jgi:transcriptional regulator with XRE-family HTH domain
MAWGEDVDLKTLLKRYRHEHGLTQEHLSEILGTDVTTVSRWERGVTKPTPTTHAKVLALCRPRTGIDWQLRRIIETTPAMIQLFLPDTMVLAASSEFQRLQKMSASEVVGLFDVDDFPPELVAEHERHGGVTKVFKDAQTSRGVHDWLASAPTNKTGNDIVLQFTSQRVVLDDSSCAIVSTSRIVCQQERIPFEVEW